ncbi:MAG: hypothetical protein KC416_02330 [Myxococcales bacterium]|nr:hypothetical protein [Myxococcales bacterium]
MDWPACGLFRTTHDVAGVPARRLVYFHNHGDPGPGIYLPVGWELNTAVFDSRGHTLTDPAQMDRLSALPKEGFYRVAETFHCCDKRCQEFAADLLVQLGYNAAGEAIVFRPVWTKKGLAIPEQGAKTDVARLSSLAPLVVPKESLASDAPLQ